MVDVLTPAEITKSITDMIDEPKEKSEYVENSEIVEVPTESRLPVKEKDISEKIADSLPPAENDDAYKPIILVSTNLNPPEDTKTKKQCNIPEDVVEETKTEVNNAAKEVKSPAKKYNIPEEYVIETPKKEKVALSIDINKYVVSKDVLKNGNYIQIARLTKTDNIKATISKLKDKYNIVLLKSESSKESAYHVLVDAGSAKNSKKLLKELKNAGYKDAFVKKL